MPFKKGIQPIGSKPFKRGEVGNPHGRPRKFLSTLKEQGYTQSEVADTFKVLITMTEEELKTVEMDKNAAILERIVAGSLLKDKGKQSLWNSEIILNRVHGKPKETVDTTVSGDITITLKLEK